MQCLRKDPGSFDLGSSKGRLLSILRIVGGYRRLVHLGDFDLRSSKLLVNLRDLTFISESFCELLLDNCTAKYSAKRIAFYGLSKNLEEVLTITRLSKLVEIYPDKQTALIALLS
jgi:hypothetical protein